MTIPMFPDDEHNRKLVANVHPPDWQNPSFDGVYDMLVIGAGTAGLITAIGAAGLGKKVALIERHLMGGDCLNVGCVPSKALIRSARAVAEVRGAGRFGVRVPEGVEVDFGAVMERMRRLRAGISPHDSAQRFSDLGIDVYMGEARFVAADAVEVEGKRLRFQKACIASGARAGAPPIPGLAEAGFLTNETVFSLTELPKRLAVIGAGPIGSELAQSFQRFGSQVYLIETEHGILPREAPSASAIVQERMLGEGVELLCCGREVEVVVVDGVRHLRLDSHDQSYDVPVDEILVAAGRIPNLEGLGLEAAGVRFHEKGVEVDDQLRTSNPKIFAAGDVASKYQFTHAADALSRIVVQNALLGFLPVRAKASALTIPWATYTDPEVAHVGKYAKELDDEGARYDTVEVDLAGVDRAILEDDLPGRLEVHVAPSGKILGATIVSSHAGDLLGELTAAMVHGIPLQKLAKVIHPYPTVSAAIQRAGDQQFRRWLEGWRDTLLFWK